MKPTWRAVLAGFVAAGPALGMVATLIFAGCLGYAFAGDAGAVI